MPAHKTKLLKTYVLSTNGQLTLHILPGYAPELNPDELVWSHMQRTGVACTPLRKGERLVDKVEAHSAPAGTCALILQGAECSLY